MGLKILDDEDDMNPMLSVVNLVDVFVVMVAALLMIIVVNPLNPYNSDDMVIVKNPNTDQMEMIVKKGEEIERYKTSEEIGQGEGSRAGVAYRLEDGSFIYVPE
jgi:hypothetical protein